MQMTYNSPSHILYLLRELAMVMGLAGCGRMIWAWRYALFQKVGETGSGGLGAGPCFS